jgi:hypothetical protein
MTNKKQLPAEMLVRQATRGGWAISDMGEGRYDLLHCCADDEALLEFFAEQLSLPAPDLLRPVPPKPKAEEASAAAIVPPPVSADLVSHMVNRFLAWRLPETFNPDGGISFRAVFNEGTPHEFKSDPSGTNLFDAQQATAMVRHMLEGAPDIGELAAQATTAMLVLADVRRALKPFESFAKVNRSAAEGEYFAIDKPDGAEHYASIRYSEFRALLRAAGLFTDDMRPSQPDASQDAAADASVKPAGVAGTPPPADADDDLDGP